MCNQAASCNVPSTLINMNVLIHWFSLQFYKFVSNCFIVNMIKEMKIDIVDPIVLLCSYCTSGVLILLVKLKLNICCDFSIVH